MFTGSTSSIWRAQVRYDLPLRNILRLFYSKQWWNVKYEKIKLIRVDNSIDSKKGDVIIWYREFLAVCPVKVKNLNECLIDEVSLKKKADMPFHSIDHLVKHKTSLTFFLINFEQLIGDIIAKCSLFVLITGGFNVRSSNC